MARSDLTRLVASHAGAQRRSLAGSVTLMVATVGVDLARPWPLALAVDRVLTSPTSATSGSGLRWLVVAAVATVLVAVASALLDARAELAAESAAERMGAALRTQVFAHAVRLDLAWHDRVRSGELVSRLTTDVSRVLDGVVAATTVLVPEALALIGVAVVLAVVDPRLAAIALVVVPVLWLLATRQRRLVRAAQHQARAESGHLTARSSDLLRNVAAIHAFGRHDRAEAAFAAHNEAVLDRATDALRVQARWAPRSETVLALGSALVLVAGGWQVLSGRGSVGVLLVTLAYTRDLYTPVRSLARLSGSLAKAGASATRICAVLDTVPAIADHPAKEPAHQPAHQLADVVHRVRFEDVTVSYGDRPAVSGLDLDVAPGETVCLVGASGSGKSTALSLLLRLRDPDGGRVTLDGHDLRDLSLRALRSHVAYVPQQAWLLDASIADNIALGAEHPSRSAVVRAGTRAGLGDVVDLLPDGWDTELGEDGRRLSGGQQRRVALARALLSDAPVMVLDEPTASLDAETAARVVASIRESTWHRTTVIATHDPALLAIADRVVDLSPCPSAAPRSAQPRTDTRREVNRHDDPTRHHRRAASARPQPEPLAQPLA